MVSDKTAVYFQLALCNHPFRQEEMVWLACNVVNRLLYKGNDDTQRRWTAYFISLEITVSSTQTLKGAHSVKQGREEVEQLFQESNNNI